jgi:hypothetical protein
VVGSFLLHCQTGTQGRKYEVSDTEDLGRDMRGGYDFADEESEV